MEEMPKTLLAWAGAARAPSAVSRSPVLLIDCQLEYVSGRLPLAGAIRLALAGALVWLGCAARPAPALEEACVSRCGSLPAVLEGDAGEQLLVENYGALVASGGEVVFLSTAARAPQLFRGSLAPEGPPAVQVTRAGEGIPDETGARRVLTRDGRHVLFKCAEGFCRASLSDGGGLVKKPGLAGSMYQFGPFLDSAHPGRYYFEARVREDPGLHILSDSFEASGPPRLLFRAPEINGWLQDVSPDGRRALAVDMRSHGDWALVLVDLEAGVARQIYPPAGEAAKVRAAVFSVDGRRIYAGTDGGRERALHVAFDAASGRELGAYEEKELPAAEITAIAEAPSGGRLALTLSAGNLDRIRLVDAGALSVDPRACFAPPHGVGGASTFAADGQRLVFEWATPNRPRDVYAADLATGTMVPLPSAKRPPAFDVEVEAAVERVPSFDGLLVPTKSCARDRPEAGTGARRRSANRPDPCERPATREARSCRGAGCGRGQGGAAPLQRGAAPAGPPPSAPSACAQGSAFWSASACTLASASQDSSSRRPRRFTMRLHRCAGDRRPRLAGDREDQDPREGA
jgi:hypothetical protein